ncbi:hypothetical protein CBR_g28063 [Chara braunii]|uniref:Uncharacterized protein n=1 Tax=Chara braunii TaxID=69332 RepID=A0A388L946_CHABU|nr:hypothetical protein CBR_g28063 [Chara braunii]|eukprot:GBG78839.1 hypothetical protein CBR_g28063 [Chara braunii]
MERVARYAAERGLDVPGRGGASGGEAGRHPVEGGVGGDGGHGAPDPTLGGGGGETEEGVIHDDREARGPGEEGVPEREDVPEFYPGTGERLEDWRRRAGKGTATEGSSKRKEGGSDPAATPARGFASRRRACIFRPYPREDDSDEDPVPEAADDPVLRIHREINETHEDPDSAETRAHTTRRGADREMLGGEEFWGPFSEVASTGGPEAQATTPTPTRRESSMPPPPATSPAPPSPVSPLQSAMATADREELGSSLPQRGLLHRGGAVRQLRLRSPSPGILQEEGPPSAAAVESSVAPAAVPNATILAAVEEIAAAAAAEAAVLEKMAASVLEEDPPAAGGGATVEGQVAAAGGAGGGTAAVEEEGAPSAAAVEGEVPGPVEEEIAAQAEVQRGGDDERLMQQFHTEELDPVIEGMTPGVARGFGISDSEIGTHLDLDLSMGLPPSCSGETSTDRAPSRDDAPRQTSTQAARERTTTESPDAARDIMEREKARLLASSDPRAQSFARTIEEATRREIGGDCVQGGVVAGEDVAEGVAAEPVPEAMSSVPEAADVAVEGRRQAVDEAVQAGQRAPVGDPSLSPTGRGSRSPHTPGRCRIRDTTAVQQDVCDTTIFGRMGINLDSTRCVTEHTARLQSGLGGGGARTTAAREVPASGCEPQRGCGRGVSTETLEYALRAATRVVQEQTPRNRGVPPRPRPVPAKGGAALGESSGAEGLGMPRGYRREQTVAEASARVVVLRKGGGPITIEEDDPDTDAVVREADKDYEGEEGGEEESRSGSDGDDDDDYDEPPPPPEPPQTRASRRSAARTSSSSRGRKRSTSGSRGGTRRHSGKGKKGR